MSDEPQPGPRMRDSSSESSDDDLELLAEPEEVSDAESDLDVRSEPSSSESGDESSSNEERSSGTWSRWTSNPRLQQFSETVGVQHSLPANAEPIDFFQLFFDDALLNEIAHQTNLYAEARQVEARKRDKYWTEPTTGAEIKTFLAVNIMMGIHRTPRIWHYWATDSRLTVPAVSTVMSRNRFEALNRYIHLSERETPQQAGGGRGLHPLHKLLPLINHLKERFPAHYKPGREISIDEAMIKFKGRSFLKQYMQGKPTRWGLKVWGAADPKTGYLLDFDVYVGKREKAMKGGLGYQVVMRVGRHYLDKGHCFFYDNFFSSVTLSEDLLARKTYSCGTVRPFRRGWPKELTFTKKSKQKMLEKEEVRFMQKGQLLATAWLDKRTVSVLSTNIRPGIGTTLRRTGKGQKEPKTIPLPVLAYNEHMGGVNKFDQLRSYCHVGRAGNKWWRYVLWFLVQASLINSHIIYAQTCQLANKKTKASQDSLQFRLAVYDALIRCRTSTRHVQTAGSLKGLATLDFSQHQQTRMQGRKRDCVNCKGKGTRAPSGRGVQTVFGCPLCQVNLCKGVCFAEFHAALQPQPQPQAQPQ